MCTSNEKKRQNFVKLINYIFIRNFLGFWISMKHFMHYFVWRFLTFLILEHLEIFFEFCYSMFDKSIYLCKTLLLISDKCCWCNYIIYFIHFNLNDWCTCFADTLSYISLLFNNLSWTFFVQRNENVYNFYEKFKGTDDMLTKQAKQL